MKKRIIIVANGALHASILTSIQKNDIVIGVDRAAYWLLMHRIIPDMAVGDFDSCSTEELNMIKRKIKLVKSYVPEKDFTDTELAVELAIVKKPNEIIIFGGFGSRADHQLAAMHLLERCESAGVTASLKNRTNDVRVITRGRTILEKREGARYVSIIPITDEICVSLEHLKYTLKNTTIRRGQTLGISNEFIGVSATVRLSRGKAFVIQSKD